MHPIGISLCKVLTRKLNGLESIERLNTSIVSHVWILIHPFLSLRPFPTYSIPWLSPENQVWALCMTTVFPGERMD